MTGPRMVTPALLVALGLAFGLVATANGAGYRYGVSDQAFYIPVVMRSIDPTLFPRDASLIDAQGHLMATDEILATLVRTTGTSLETLYLGCYLISLALMWIGLTSIAMRIYRSPWALVGTRRGVHASPPHSRNKRQLVRAVLPSTHARVRAWHARRGSPPAPSFVGGDCVGRRGRTRPRHNRSVVLRPSSAWLSRCWMSGCGDLGR